MSKRKISTFRDYKKLDPDPANKIPNKCKIYRYVIDVMFCKHSAGMSGRGVKAQNASKKPVPGPIA